MTGLAPAVAASTAFAAVVAVAAVAAVAARAGAGPAHALPQVVARSLAEAWSEITFWLPAVLLPLLLLGWYLSYSAGRLDRLHHRVESSRAALDAQLARRAAAALEVAHVLDPATGLLLTDAAAEALVAAEEGVASIAVVEDVENDLTRALGAAFSDADDVTALRSDVLAAETLDLLGQACLRVQLARRFHNDAVAQAQRVRGKRVVRWFRLAGHAARPQMIELDDTVPPALSSLRS